MKNFIKFLAGLTMGLIIILAILATFGIVPVIVLFILALCNVVTWSLCGTIAAIYGIILAAAIGLYVWMLFKGVNDYEDF